MAASGDLLAAFGNRVAKRHRHLRRWARQSQTDCFRLYDRDIPEMAFALDVYGPKALLQQYVRRGEHVAPGWLEEVAQCAADAVGIARSDVVARTRAKVDRRTGQHERSEAGGSEFCVLEGGLRFLVNLETYLDTGLFLDHRPLRALVGGRVRGGHFLNLFCYTGSFTVHAAAGGAASTVSVDLSRTYLDWARRNLAANGLLDDRHSLVRADARTWLTEAQAGGRRFDCIVLDPPAYSSSKRMVGVFDVQRDHPGVIGAAASLLAPGGELFFSCNLTGFRLSPDLPGLAVEDITDRTVPEDFRNRSIHRCWRIRRAG
ncbi:MAG: methyltransferase domain-containing protein [Betaproteobacteria bacterium]|nr:methyltransferase domain-containing protein [Betaproteobacteria bacterium]